MTRANGILAATIVALGATASGACSDRPQLPPEGQILLYVTTDAVLPSPPDDPAAVFGNFDRLSIEIFPPGKTEPCIGCAREFRVDSKLVDEGRASVGYVPEPNVPGTRARIRLYRTRGAEVIAPRVTSTIETVVAFPVVSAEGIVEITVVLDTAKVGAPVGTLDAPGAPRLGKPPRGIVGTWEAQRRRPCAGDAKPGEVCVPGGAYWFGEPRERIAFPNQKHALERLTAVSPFFMDASEVTVGKFQESGLADKSGPGQRLVDKECTYDEGPGAQLDLPVNCIAREMAMAYCAKKGSRLPTEAEWEYVATNLGRTDLYPWGDEHPRCEDAVFARAIGNAPNAAYKACISPTVVAGAAKVGSSVRDRVKLPGGEIVDLAGNLAEWMADDYADELDPCWAAPPFVLLDPVCRVKNELRRSLRGGHYATEVNNVNVKLRSLILDNATGTGTRPHSGGFRCVRASE